MKLDKRPTTFEWPYSVYPKGKKKQTFKTSFIIYAYEKHYQIPENCVIADYSLFTQLNVLQFQ